MPLDSYWQKRDFHRTPEPRGRPRSRKTGPLQFVIQQHAARRLHYDFRLEYAGVLWSWAIPKGPSLDPKERRLAVQTEDHPLEYADFEGVIPEHEYGAGAVLVWDRGTWVPDGDPARGLADGKLDFRLHGDKLRGRWTLVRMPPRRDRKEAKVNWLLIKRRDRQARARDSAEIVDSRPESVLTGRALDAVGAASDRVWHPDRVEQDPTRVPQVGRPDTIEGARQGKLPPTPRPQLATLVDDVPEGTGWFHEPKLDGYRVLCRIESERATLLTRRGNDWSDRFGSIAQAARALPCRSALLDGEAVLFDERGITDFQRLQRAIGRDDPAIALVAFDLLYLDGWDLRGAPLRARKELLRLLLSEADDAIRYGDHIEGRGGDFFREACRAGLEGIVSKRASDPYRSGRTRSWLKIKCHKREEMVVIGFSEPSGSRTALGALLLGTRPEPGAPLRYAGKVGTGFDDETLVMLRERLEHRLRPTAPAEGVPRGSRARGVHWVEPELVAEIAFSEWTRDGIVRHATFRGLREDKPAAEVARELPQRVSPARPRAAVAIAGVTLTNPDKVLYRDQGITKLQLARYYQDIAELALPYLRDRPLTLLRCPDGPSGSCFYQKHIAPGVPAVVPRVTVEPDGEPYGMIDGLPSLVAMVQLGVLELHVWGSRAGSLDQPDIIVFDLDPAEDVPWGRVVDGAHRLREILRRLQLAAFARLTGGKGVHVVVPLVPGPGWDEVKAFARGVAEHVVRDDPSAFTARMSKHRRGGKIFIDYFRNAREATAIAAYSPRAKSGAPVALPVEWDELEGDEAEPPRYGVRDVPSVVRERKRDPWQGFDDARRPLRAPSRSRRKR